MTPGAWVGASGGDEVLLRTVVGECGCGCGAEKRGEESEGELEELHLGGGMIGRGNFRHSRRMKEIGRRNGRAGSLGVFRTGERCDYRFVEGPGDLGIYTHQ